MSDNEQLPYHQQRMLRKNDLAPKLPTRKEKKPLRKVSLKRQAEMKQEKKTGKPVSKLALDKWFLDIQIKHCKSYSSGGGCFCMECNEFIPVQFIRHATAHLLPKKIFKSVAIHELNYLILGASCGCHEKTHRVDKFVQMKIFPEAARRIKIMMPLLPFDELKHLSSQLLIALDNAD